MDLQALNKSIQERNVLKKLLYKHIILFKLLLSDAFYLIKAYGFIIGNTKILPDDLESIVNDSLIDFKALNMLILCKDKLIKKLIIEEVDTENQTCNFCIEYYDNVSKVDKKVKYNLGNIKSVSTQDMSLIDLEYYLNIFYTYSIDLQGLINRLYLSCEYYNDQVNRNIDT